MKIKLGIEASERERKWFKRAVWIGVPLLVVAYFVAVFLVGGQYTEFWAYVKKPHKSEFVQDMYGCKEKNYGSATLNKIFSNQRPPYPRDANVWLFQSYGDLAHDDEILKYPECLGLVLANAAKYDGKIVINIYDTQRKKVIYRMVKYPIE